MLLIESFNSRRDMYGNCYNAIRVENIDTGKTALGTISGNHSNVASGLHTLFGGWEGVRTHSRTIETERAIREYNRETKGAPYAGCTGEQIAAWIVANVGPVAGAVSLVAAE